jgi:hypothetical protein
MSKTSSGARLGAQATMASIVEEQEKYGDMLERQTSKKSGFAGQ